MSFKVETKGKVCLKDTKVEINRAEFANSLEKEMNLVDLYMKSKEGNMRAVSLSFPSF